MQRTASQSQTISLREEIQRYIEEHGFRISNPESLNDHRYDGTISQTRSLVDISILDIANQEYKMDESGEKLPKMYEDLVDFIKQVPEVQQIQLKPLLFAFFYFMFQ